MLRGSMNLIFSMVYRTRSPIHIWNLHALCVPHTHQKQEKNSAPLLPQELYVSHQTKFCCSVTTTAESFSPEKYSAVLLPQRQCFLPEKYFAVLATQQQIFIYLFFCGIGTACVRSQSASRVAQSVLQLYSSSWCQSELADRLTGQTGSHLSGSNSFENNHN